MPSATKFFVRPDQIFEGIVELDQDDALHLDRVLRAKIGDKIAVMDGSGKQYEARLVELSKTRAVAKIESESSPDTEPAISITVAQSLPKTADKLEWVLQHGVEVGAAEFVIFRSRRSEAGKLAEKPERWAKIVKTAAEQSNRVKLPAVSFAPNLQELVARTETYDLVLLCDEAERSRALKSLILGAKLRRVMILIGPEGGWADEERDLCIEAAVKPVSLGPRVLRTETAALVALSQILALIDN